MSTAMALEGIRVIDISTVIGAPTIGRVLADFGAEVIKVEAPEGDPVRHMGAKYKEQSLTWKYYSRNKKCIGLNLRKEEAQQIIRDLAKESDILLENFRPGRMDKWGIGYETLSKLNPGLIMLSFTGYGQDGPYSDKPAFGTLIEGMSGFACMVGYPDKPPTLPPFALADGVAASFGLYSIMFALYHRDVKKGKGQHIDVSLWEPLFSLIGPNAPAYDKLGTIPPRIGNRAYTSAPRNTYKTKDGHWVATAGATPATAERIMQAVELGHLLEDPKFKDNRSRIQNVEELDVMVQKWFDGKTRDEAFEIFEKFEAPIGPLYTIEDIINDPHAQHRNMVEKVKDEELGEDILMEGIFPKMSATPGKIRHLGRKLGADTEDVLSSILKYPDDKIKELNEKGIIVT